MEQKQYQQPPPQSQYTPSAPAANYDMDQHPIEPPPPGPVYQQSSYPVQGQPQQQPPHPQPAHTSQVYPPQIQHYPPPSQEASYQASIPDFAAQHSSYLPPDQAQQPQTFPPPSQPSQPPPYFPAQIPSQEHPPSMPARPNANTALQYNPATYALQGVYNPPPPPKRRQSPVFNDDDPNNPISYIRDPHKLVAYFVPFPKPRLHNIDPSKIPERFLIYTPPPPPLAKPNEDKKEGKAHKIQRKWQEEVRQAKTSTAKTASWEGVKSKATRGISWAMDRTTTANIDFLGRVTPQSDHKSDTEDDGVVEGKTTKKTIGVEEMVLVYPSTMKESPDQLRSEFVNTMLRTKSKAQRDTVIATGLLPVTYGIDIISTVVWPFGGLGEIDTVWAYTSFRGAKAARSVTKRLTSSSSSGNPDETKLHLTFTPSQRLEVLRVYLATECHKVDPKLFASVGIHAPTESQILTAIGWSPSLGEKNWEDEQWEVREVKEDMRTGMHKGAREWNKWCKAFQKNPEKALKK